MTDMNLMTTGGVMEPTAVEAWNFHEQFHTFHAHGYAQQMGSGQVVGDVVGTVSLAGFTHAWIGIPLL